MRYKEALPKTVGLVDVLRTFSPSEGKPVLASSYLKRQCLQLIKTHRAVTE